jgi:alpha-L-fucosidase
MTLQPEPTAGDTAWFTEARFGLFIHWGLYALPARHEWVRNQEKISNEDYEKYFQHFDPDLYDPAVWADATANAGMKYFVVTTKHHEGFCLWDSALTDYKAPNTPYGKDLLRPMVKAFRAKDMKVGFYHSLIDWHHPDYTVDDLHPLRDNAEARAANSGKDLNRYVDYLYGQTRELLTQFGPVDILWYDFSYDGKGKEQWRSEELIRQIREMQPNIILNDRLQIDQDIKTPEQFQPRGWVMVDGKPVVWEACQTLSGSWGYFRDEETWKSVDTLVQMLIDNVSKGGNLLLNVGPTGRGEFDYRVLDRLAGMGEWMKRHSRAIYGCTQAPAEYATPQDCRLTYNPKTNRLYVHVFAWPFQELHLDGGFAGKIAYAQLLNDASEIKMERRPDWQGSKDVAADTVTLRLPVKKPPVTVPVIELFLK